VTDPSDGCKRGSKPVSLQRNPCCRGQPAWPFLWAPRVGPAASLSGCGFASPNNRGPRTASSTPPHEGCFEGHQQAKNEGHAPLAPCLCTQGALRDINRPRIRGEGCQCTEGPAQRHSFLLPQCRGRLRLPEAARAFSELMHLWLGPVL